jgi:choline dehydrogenase-like flavoprotein
VLKLSGKLYLRQTRCLEHEWGTKITTDSDLAKYIRDKITPTQYHPVGTRAKMPLELGGVVDEELMVYGIGRLSIVDASMITWIVRATLQGTVYAVAEKVKATPFLH